MKTLLIILLVLVSTQIFGQSALVLEDNFTYTLGNLGSQNSWVSTGSGTDVKVKNSPTLSYSGYPSGGSFLEIGSVAVGGSYKGKEPYKQFVSDFSLTASNALSNTVVYYSFLTRVVAPRRNGANVDYLLSLRTNEGKMIGHFYVKYSSSNPSKVNFGIYTKSEVDSNKIEWTTATYDLNTSYLIAIRYDIKVGGDNDQMYMWVNPPLSLTPPSVASAAAVLTAGQEEYSSVGNVTSVQLHQRDYASQIQFDGIRTSFAKGPISTAANNLESWDKLDLNSSTLPVTFSSFTATRQGYHVLVQWSTSQEINALNFQVERSVDGINYTTVGTVAAKGNSTTSQHYRFVDYNNTAALSYYRIKQVDVDGTFEYTAIRTVSNSQSALIRFGIANGTINIYNSGVTRTNVSFRIVNLSGQVVYETRIARMEGKSTMHIPMKGHYILHLTDEKDLSQAQQVIF